MAILQEYYAKDYRGVGSWHRLEQEPGAWDGSLVRARAQHEFVLRQASLVHGMPAIESWLDVGAGYGCLLDEAKERGTGKTAAIEPDGHSSARLTRSGHDVFGALEQVPGSWDVISFSHLLEHLATPLNFLRQVRSLLSDKGYVFCEVPNEMHLDSATNDAPHLVFFTPACLASMFETGGFEVLAIQTCGRAWDSRWTDALRDLTRRVGMRLVASPPGWLDRAVHHHFHYSQDGRQWIRLLATPSLR
jgi:SAM-dependent methyltransferase